MKMQERRIYLFCSIFLVCVLVWSRWKKKQIRSGGKFFNYLRDNVRFTRYLKTFYQTLLVKQSSRKLISADKIWLVCFLITLLTPFSYTVVSRVSSRVCHKVVPTLPLLSIRKHVVKSTTVWVLLNEVKIMIVFLIIVSSVLLLSTTNFL